MEPCPEPVPGDPGEARVELVRADRRYAACSGPGTEALKIRLSRATLQRNQAGRGGTWSSGDGGNGTDGSARVCRTLTEAGQAVRCSVRMRRRGEDLVAEVAWLRSLGTPTWSSRGSTVRSGAGDPAGCNDVTRGSATGPGNDPLRSLDVSRSCRWLLRRWTHRATGGGLLPTQRCRDRLACLHHLCRQSLHIPLGDAVRRHEQAQ